MAFGKNVSLEAEVIEIIEGYMHRTRKNFSATMNIIIKDWDKISIELSKLKGTPIQEEIKENPEIKETFKLGDSKEMDPEDIWINKPKKPSELKRRKK